MYDHYCKIKIRNRLTNTYLFCIIKITVDCIVQIWNNLIRKTMNREEQVLKVIDGWTFGEICDETKGLQ